MISITICGKDGWERLSTLRGSLLWVATPFGSISSLSPTNTPIKSSQLHKEFSKIFTSFSLNSTAFSSSNEEKSSPSKIWKECTALFTPTSSNSKHPTDKFLRNLLESTLVQVFSTRQRTMSFRRWISGWPERKIMMTWLPFSTNNLMSWPVSLDSSSSLTWSQLKIWQEEWQRGQVQRERPLLGKLGTRPLVSWVSQPKLTIDCSTSTSNLAPTTVWSNPIWQRLLQPDTKE